MYSNVANRKKLFNTLTVTMFFIAFFRTITDKKYLKTHLSLADELD